MFLKAFCGRVVKIWDFVEKGERDFLFAWVYYRIKKKDRRNCKILFILDWYLPTVLKDIPYFILQYILNL